MFRKAPIFDFLRTLKIILTFVQIRDIYNGLTIELSSLRSPAGGGE
jgi:hypothetical protein